MIKYLIIFLLINLNVSQGQDIPENQTKSIEVIMGIDKIVTLDFTPSTKVQVGNDGILGHQIIPQKKQITFKGAKPGKTSVTLRDSVGDIKARYLVTITANDLSKIVQELKEFLGDVEGLEIGIKGNTVYVGGQIVVPNDIGKVVVVLEKYGDQVLRLVELSPQTQRVIAKKMQEEIQKNNLKDVTVRVLNKIFILEGVTNSEGLKSLAQNIAETYIPDLIESLARQTRSVQAVKGRGIIKNLISVNQKKQTPPVPKQIKVVAQFVELTKDYTKIFGFKWSPVLSGDGGSINIGKTNSGVTTRSEGTLAATISNLFPKLASAKSAGHARVIQSGVIIMKENVKGSIVRRLSKASTVGSGEFTQQVNAEAGFTLNVTPSILPGEKIDLKVNLAVNSTQGDPPENLSNTVDTNVIVKTKESAVIGGVVSSNDSTAFDKDPPFGVDNIENGTPLFSFLKSKAYTSQRNQFAMFITPEIIDSASSGTADIKRKFRRRRR